LVLLARKPEPAFQINSKLYQTLLPGKQKSYPSVITFLGNVQKSRILRRLLGGDQNYPMFPHGQTHLWLDPASRPDQPVLIADCELASHTASLSDTTLSSGPGGFTTIRWANPIKHSSRDLTASVCSRILAPLSNILVIFAADFKGQHEVARFIAEMINSYAQHDLLHILKPQLVVVTSSRASRSGKTTPETLVQLIKTLLTKLLTNNDWNQAENLISTCFHSVQMVELSSRLNLQQSTK
jgi:hypothetical protein